MRKNNLLIRKYIICLFIIPALIFTFCTDPASEQDSKAIVTTLYEGPAPAGLYSLFWNGKDEDETFVPSGTYYVRLYSRDFTFTLEITAQEGTGGATNNTGIQIIEGDWGITEIRENIPEPFRIQDGTMITFVISTFDSGQSIQLTIRDEE